MIEVFMGGFDKINLIQFLCIIRGAKVTSIKQISEIAKYEESSKKEYFDFEIDGYQGAISNRSKDFSDAVISTVCGSFLVTQSDIEFDAFEHSK
jgi:hypothetical protein